MESIPEMQVASGGSGPKGSWLSIPPHPLAQRRAALEMGAWREELLVLLKQGLTCGRLLMLFP